eukprot:4280231-Prymnesium_polylepis.1
MSWIIGMTCTMYAARGMAALVLEVSEQPAARSIYRAPWRGSGARLVAGVGLGGLRRHPFRRSAPTRSCGKQTAQ